MKTLDEALDVIIAKDENDEARVKSEAQRFGPTVREIMTSKRVAELCNDGLRYLVSSTKDPLDMPFMIWIHAFTDGVKIGMEMERQEFRGSKKPCRKKS